MRRLVDQIREAVAAFAGLKTPPALIGGLARAAHHVVRATSDVNFLAHADDGDRLHTLWLAPYVPERRGSPIDPCMELMEVVEALCPRWP